MMHSDHGDGSFLPLNTLIQTGTGATCFAPSQRHSTLFPHRQTFRLVSAGNIHLYLSLLLLFRLVPAQHSTTTFKTTDSEIRHTCPSRRRGRATQVAAVGRHGDGVQASWDEEVEGALFGLPGEDPLSHNRGGVCLTEDHSEAVPVTERRTPVDAQRRFISVTDKQLLHGARSWRDRIHYLTSALSDRSNTSLQQPTRKLV